MSVTQAAGAEDRALAAVRAIWERRKDEILGRVELLEDAVAALMDHGLDEPQRLQARRAAHQLAGSAGTFGFPRGSELAREMEHMLDHGASVGVAQVPRLAELVVSLRSELEGEPEGRLAIESAPPAGREHVLLVVEDDPERAERLTVEALGRGLRSRRAPWGRAPRAIEMERPDVVLLVSEAPERADDALELLAELAALAPEVPILFLAPPGALVDRVEVARRGGRGVLSATLPPAQVIDAVTQLVERLRMPEVKVLAVDDDPTVLAVLSELLGSQGLDVTTLEHPRELWEALDQVSPDLLVLDVDMPGVSGIELCRTVRDDARFAGLPILFLTARTDADTVHRLFAAGADDYVPKPIVGPELITRITNRVERARLLRSFADTDALTGVSSRARSVELLGRFTRLADRFGQPLSLAVLDLDNLKGVNDSFGHSGGDAVLRRLGQSLLDALRGEDVVARWGGQELVAGMYGMSKEDSVQRLAELLEGFRGERFAAGDGRHFRTSFSAGVAQYPEDGTDLQSLYRAADVAVQQAKAAGRDRVLPAGWHPDRTIHTADIVLVEDDETLAALLMHALETRGYRARWLSDGREAAGLLAGPDPDLRAPLVLLDVDLPGLSGLEVLRRLADQGTLRRTRVVMLTARSAETEVLTALELGAFDHVAKPFSVPVLIQRIRRALRR